MIESPPRVATNIILTPRFPSNTGEVIYEAYRQEIFGRALKLLLGKPAGREEAEDLASETFTRAYAALPSLEAKLVQRGGSLAVRPWLHRIETNLFLDKKRRGALIAWESIEQQEEERHLAYISPDDPVKSSLVMETRRTVQEVLAQLPPRYKEALMLFEDTGLSCGQIAHKIGTTPGAVRSILIRSREKFRQLYPVDPEDFS